MLIREKSLRDPSFFVEILCWTKDPRERPADLPFVLWPRQRMFLTELERALGHKQDMLTEKSRDVGVTWLGMALILLHWLWDDGFTAHLGSQKEEYVDKSGDMKTLFEKLRYILFRLPDEFIPKGFNPRFHSSFMKLFNPVNGNLITGESSNKNFGRQARASLAWLDEFGHWDHAEESWTSISQVTPVKFIVSTPKGRYTCFSRLRWHSKIKIFTFSWKDDPRRDQKWYDSEKYSGKYTDAQFAQEVDMSYEGSAGAPVIPEFDKKRHVVNYIFNPTKPLIRTMDFGKRHPSTSFFQMDNNILRQLYELLGNDLGIHDWTLISNYCSGVAMEPEQIDRIRYLCKNNKVEDKSDIAHLQVFNSPVFQDYCDQAGNQKSDKSNQSSIDVISANGWKPAYRWSSIGEGCAILSKMFLDDVYTVSSSCPLTIQAFEGGYHKDDEGKPYKDGVYDNLVDGIRYVGQELFSHLDKKTVVVKKSRYDQMVDKGVPEPYARFLLEDQMTQRNTIEEIRSNSHNTGYNLGG